jgi:DNA-binding CsgD family transcriptional regulator
MDTNWNWLQDTGNSLDGGMAPAAGTGNVGLAEIACARGELGTARRYAWLLLTLTEALTLGYPEGYVRVFADEGAPMRALPGRVAASQTILGLVEPLTSREQQVLRLLAAGRANRDIAAELVVTLDTVKRHVTHILAKLGAVNRTEAVARARGLNLIP